MLKRFVFGFVALVLAFAVLLVVFSSNPIVSKAGTLGSGWPQNPTPSDGQTNVSLTPTFSWTYETPDNSSSSCNPSGSYANLYLWSCSAHNDSCLVGFASKQSNTQSIYDIAASEVHPYTSPGHPDYSQSFTFLSNTQYWWYVTPKACGLLHFEENKAWTFRTLTPQTPQHKACSNMACILVDGAGNNTCSVDSECFHNVCQNLACTKVAGGGASNCQVNADCAPVTHKACSNMACVVVPGAGRDSCSTDAQCYRFACQNDACTKLDGGGTNTCTSSSQCQPASQRVVCDSLTINQNSGTAPLAVNSTLTGHTENGGSIVNYKFSFGDGSADVNQSGNSLGHTFNNIGVYVISGVVTDNLGNQAGGSVCQKVVTGGQVLGVSTPPSTIPKTGPESMALFGLFGSVIFGWVIRKFKS